MIENENTETPPGVATVEAETGTDVVAVVGVEDLQGMTLDIVHANLFGSFLICGTLVGIFLFRRFIK